MACRAITDGLERINWCESENIFMQEVPNIEYAGSALLHLRISQLAQDTLLGLQSCSPSNSTDIHPYIDGGQPETKHRKEFGSVMALDAEYMFTALQS